MQSIGRAAGSKALYLLSECAQNSQEKNFPPMVSSHSESTKVKLTHPTEIQKSMEVKRRKEAKKQNDFCGGKRHIATFQNYRNQLVLGRPRKAWYRPKASFTSCSARWQRTWHVQRYWRAKGAKRTKQPKARPKNNTL